MKFLSLKILILCILLPPVLYILTLRSIESGFEKRYTKQVEDSYVGDTRPLLDGSLKIQDVIRDNIDRFLENNRLRFWGLAVVVTVTTEKGALVYPAAFDLEEQTAESKDPMVVAAENYQLMRKGLFVHVDVELEHNTLLSNFILGCTIAVFLSILYIHYRSALKKSKDDEAKKAEEIYRLSGLESRYRERLGLLEKERENLKTVIDETKRDLAGVKELADKNEDEMLKEMLELEEQLNENIRLQEQQKRQIDELNEELEKIEKEKPKKEKQRQKNLENLKKRFLALYKNLFFHDRAIRGFDVLEEEMKIKAEEVIHQLNGEPAVVPVKRKIFGKKGMETIFEVIFSYKGRLYFRNTKGGKIEILIIGTKNTQTKDLEFLNNL